MRLELRLLAHPADGRCSRIGLYASLSATFMSFTR
jgi:hypothetical protein